jgi:hypothetical protein
VQQSDVSIRHSVFTRAVSLAVALSLTLSATPTFASDREAAPLAGSLTVSSDPAGAAVYLDGTFAGQTPINLARLAAGDHRVRVVKDGYLENGRIVNVASSGAKRVAVKLTRSVGAGAAISTMSPAAASGGSFFTSPLFLGLIGGGAAAAYFLTKKDKTTAPSNNGNTPTTPTPTPPAAPTNHAPVVSSVTVTPAFGVQDKTSFSFTANASDSDGDALTYSWNIGGATFTGQTVAGQIFNTGGSKTATVTVSDGKSFSQGLTGSGSQTFNVNTMTGSWTGSGDILGPLYDGFDADQRSGHGDL